VSGSFMPVSPPAPGLDARLLRFRSRPSREEAHALADALLAAGRTRDVRDVVATARAALPEDGELLVWEGRSWLADGDQLRAQSALLMAAKLAPSRPEPFRWLGEVLLERGDALRARKVLDRAAALSNGGDPAIQRLQARAGGGGRGPGVAPPPLPSGPGRGRTASAVMPAADQGDSPELDEDTPTTFLERKSVPSFEDNSTVQWDEDEIASLRERAAGPPDDEGPTAPGAELPALAKPGSVPGFAPAPTPTPRLDRALPRALADLRPPGAPPLPPPTGRHGGPPAGTAPDVVEDDDDPFDALEAALEADAGDAGHAGLAPSASEARRTAPRPPPAPAPAPAAREPFPEDAADDLDPEADVTWGERLGTEEDVDGVLGMLRREGFFEEPVDGAVPGWASRKELARARTRTRGAFAVAWGVAVVAVAGAFYGWSRYVEGRHAEAARLRDQAAAAALGGSHEDLLAAERALRLARDLDPNDTEGPGALLFVHGQRALEDGQFEAGYLRPSIARAERMDADPAMQHAARAVLYAADRDYAAVQKELAQAVEARGDDPRIQYLAGRLGQRLGRDDAVERLEAAVEAEPRLVAAALALVELRADQGRTKDAGKLLGDVLSHDGEHLRARVWQLLLEEADRQPAAGLADAKALDEEVAEEGAATDRVLLELARAGFHLRAGDRDAARSAVTAAAKAGASEPRLLARVAEASVEVGRLPEAEATARRAVAGAPGNADFRKLLAEVLLARYDGIGALRTLAPLSMDDPDVLRMSAHGALLAGQPAALEQADQALTAHIEGHPDETGVALEALRLRLRLAREGPAAVLADARALVRSHPDDPSAGLALGETLLGAGRAKDAVRTLSTVVEARPDAAEGHLLLGRAHRLAGDVEAAETELRRALALAPGHLEARVVLGRLLLDKGAFEEADAVYQELADRTGRVGGASATLLGRLGRVEALIGRGIFDEAALQLKQLKDAERSTPSARVVAAQLALAGGEGEKAAELLQPLAEADEPSPVVLALLGDALAAQGALDDAAARYERALAEDAGMPEALVGLAEVILWGDEPDADLIVERAQDALDALDVRLRPPSFRARVLVALGAGHLVDGRRHAEDALEPLRTAAELPGAPSAVWFHLGRALEWTGASGGDAREAYARYLTEAPDGRYAGPARRAAD